jgi:hypothetical protein
MSLGEEKPYPFFVYFKFSWSFMFLQLESHYSFIPDLVGLVLCSPLLIFESSVELALCFVSLVRALERNKLTISLFTFVLAPVVPTRRLLIH